MANLGNTIINGILRVNGKINVGESITAPSFIGDLTGTASGNIKALSVSGKTITYTKGDGTTGTITTQDTTYTFTNGLSNSSGTVSNSGVRSIATGGTNGTISVNTNGTSAEVVVKGLAGSAYKAVDTSISAASTSSNLPTSAAVASFVEGKGYLTSDTKVKINKTNPSAEASYFPIWYTGVTGTGETNANDGFRYNTFEGTTNTQGIGKIVLGNNIASGTAGNKYGLLQLYSRSTSYGYLIQNDVSSQVIHNLPSTGGTLLNTGTTSFTQTLTSGTELAKIKINGTEKAIYAPTSVDKATKDSDGNQINTTYLKKTGGTMTGDIGLPITRASIDGSVPYAGSLMGEKDDISEIADYKTYLGGAQFLTNNVQQWYSLISIRHRNGNNDGKGYGMYLRSRLANNGSLMWGKDYIEGNTHHWIKDRIILDSDNYTTYTINKDNIVTLSGAQTITGKKIFNGSDGLQYSGISTTASANESRGVWFNADSSTGVGTPVMNINKFTYNPSTDVLKVGSITGNASTATALQNAKTISLTGDVTGSTSFDGSANASITTTVADDSHNHTATTLPVVTNINKTTKTAINTTTGWFTIAKTPVNNEFWSCRLLVEVKASTSQWQTYELDLVGYGNGTPTARLMERTVGTAMISQFRVFYPKAINNGYGAGIDIYSNVTTSKNIKVTLLQSENVELTDITSSILNSTYHNSTSMVGGGSGVYSMQGYTQGWIDSAGITTSVRNDQLFTAGEAIATNDIVALGIDGKYYKVTNTTASFDARTCLSGRSEANYAADAATYVRQLYSFTPLAAYTTNNDGMVANKSVYVEGTLTNDGVFKSNGKVTCTLTNGKSYMRLGIAISTTVLYMDKNVYCFSLDEDGFLTNYNGFGIGAVRSVDSGETCDLDIE